MFVIVFFCFRMELSLLNGNFTSYFSATYCDWTGWLVMVQTGDFLNCAQLHVHKIAV